jgi:Protein of unknown function (DUF2946)
MFRRLITRQPNLMLALLALTLAIRVIVPSGFMPTTDASGMVRISMCSGMGPQTAWLDKSGRIHKEAPTHSQHDPQPCGFSVLGLGLDVQATSAVVIEHFSASELRPLSRQTLSIGHGLAAPPPPSTGPPSLI